MCRSLWLFAGFDPFPLTGLSISPLCVLFLLPPEPEASLILKVLPLRLRPDPEVFCPRASDLDISFSSPNLTKPYPRERPVAGSYIILADLVLWNKGVKRATSSPSVTSRPRSPTKIEYSPSHLGCTPGRPVAQLTGESHGSKSQSHALFALLCQIRLTFERPL